MNLAELADELDRAAAITQAEADEGIAAATGALDAAKAAVQPAIDRTAKLEAELKAAKDEVEAGQPAISAATSVLDGLNANAAALRQSIATCEELLKQPITEDPQQPVIAPMRVPTAALLIIMRKRGLREQFDDVCASLPPEQQEYVKEMLQMPYTRRDHPLVAMVQQAFGWTDAEVDALFVDADAI